MPLAASGRPPPARSPSLCPCPMIDMRALADTPVPTRRTVASGRPDSGKPQGPAIGNPCRCRPGISPLPTRSSRHLNRGATTVRDFGRTWRGDGAESAPQPWTMVPAARPFARYFDAHKLECARGAERRRGAGRVAHRGEGGADAGAAIAQSARLSGGDSRFPQGPRPALQHRLLSDDRDRGAAGRLSRRERVRRVRRAVG